MDRRTDRYIKSINARFDSSSDDAVRAVCWEARKILQADDGLGEFIMAMGACFFTIKEGGCYDTSEMSDEEYEAFEESDDYLYSYNGIIEHERSEYVWQKDFFDMVDDLNDKFKVCGFPVRFTANSRPVHDWGDTGKDPVVYVEMLHDGGFLDLIGDRL